MGLPNLPALIPPPILQPEHPPLPMTITLELEPLVRLSAVGAKETIVNIRPAAPSPQTTQPDQPLTPRSAKSTNLLQNFIESFKEVESYRYVRRDRSCFDGTC